MHHVGLLGLARIAAALRCYDLMITQSLWLLVGQPVVQAVEMVLMTCADLQESTQTDVVYFMLLTNPKAVCH